MENANPAAGPAEEHAAAPPEESLEEQEGVDTASLEEPTAQLAAVVAERDWLASEKAALQDRFLRRQADFENFRRRVGKERAEFAEYAGMESVRAILPVLDDFERALKAAPGGEGPDREYVKGIEMIYERLLGILKKLGLEPIAALGEPFDPNVHHAVETLQSEEAEDHTVLEELQRGYNFRGRLLREAMVKVAVKPSLAAADDEPR